MVKEHVEMKRVLQEKLSSQTHHTQQSETRYGMLYNMLYCIIFYNNF